MTCDVQTLHRIYLILICHAMPCITAFLCSELMRYKQQAVKTPFNVNGHEFLDLASYALVSFLCSFHAFFPWFRLTGGLDAINS